MKRNIFVSAADVKQHWEHNITSHCLQLGKQHQHYNGNLQRDELLVPVQFSTCSTSLANYMPAKQCEQNTNCKIAVGWVFNFAWKSPIQSLVYGNFILQSPL